MKIGDYELHGDVSRNEHFAAVRADFELITRGWGSDALDDLTARLELLSEYWTKNFPLSDAERRIARAMIARLATLGGVKLPEIN